ncbi:MAG: hypothetical protein ACXAC7_22035 [Candidatus Hodarchaeales archaeon]|jgi:hypothetical protein
MSDLERSKKAQQLMVDYYIGVDTYDSDALAYLLARKVGKDTEILLCKSMPEKNEFMQEVENLAKYFNATVIGF